MCGAAGTADEGLCIGCMAKDFYVDPDAVADPCDPQEMATKALQCGEFQHLLHYVSEEHQAIHGEEFERVFGKAGIDNSVVRLITFVSGGVVMALMFLLLGKFGRKCRGNEELESVN